MGILEQITEMKKMGMSESEIINNLQQQRVSPKEISDALSQLQIKSAIMAPNYYEEEQQTNQLQVPTPQENYFQQYPGDYENENESENEENPAPLPQQTYIPRPEYSQQNYQEQPNNYQQYPEYPQEEYYE